MFENALLESSPRRVSVLRRIPYLLAYVVESIIVGLLVLLPLIYTQALPRDGLTSGVCLLPPRGQPPGPVWGRPMRTLHRPAVDPFQAPIRIPPRVVQITEAIAPPEVHIPPGLWIPGTPSGLGGGSGYVPGGVPWGQEPTLPPPPVARTAPRPRTILRLSKGVVAARLLYQPKPVYPQLAIMARIQGTVILQAIISKDGSVQELKVLSGHPLLVRAAIDAVKTWRYQPTLLNDEPVDLLTEIEVNFSLAE